MPDLIKELRNEHTMIIDDIYDIERLGYSFKGRKEEIFYC